jgi:hypothetical protein
MRRVHLERLDEALDPNVPHEDLFVYSRSAMPSIVVLASGNRDMARIQIRVYNAGVEANGALRSGC